jgi:sugar/nucleoside kinase (ribokinase family)
MRRPPACEDRELDLIVLGEINPDIVVTDPDPVPRFGQQEQVVDAITMTIGSSSVIAACGAARLGLRVAMVGVVGDDPFGRFMLEAMRERGIDTTGCRIDPGMPTGATVILARATDRAIFTALGTIAAASAMDVSAELLARARHLHVGSYFLQDELAREVPDLFRRARGAGLTTSVDPNDDPTKGWDGGLADTLAETDVFLPNAAEICAIGGYDDPIDASTSLAERVQPSPGIVVKLGPAGAAAIVAGVGVERCGAYPADPVDTIGAGDSFDAGFLAGWLDGAPISTALRMGAICGALSTRSTGGTAAQPTRDEVDRALRGWV